MLTRIPSPRELLLPIAFALIAAVLAIGVWRGFGGVVPFQPQGYRITADLPEADSVLANSDVRIAGVDVGHVVSVESLGRRARVELEIDPEFAPLRRDARIVVRSKTLLGEGYLEVAPGDRKAAPIADGGRIPGSGVVRAQRLDDVLQAFPESTRRDMRRMLAGLAGAFDGRAMALNQALGRAPGVVGNLEAVARRLQRQQEPLRSLLGSSTDVFEALGSQDAALVGAIRQGSRVFATTAARDRDLAALVDALPPFLGDLRVASGRLQGASGDLRRAVAALRPTAPLVAPALVALRDDTKRLQAGFRKVAPAFRDTTKALPSVTRLLDGVGPSLANVHLAARQLLPFVQLSAASRDNFVANFANVAATFNGRTVVPGGKLGQYAGGWLTAWNEIVGGWTKKLPTNRANPYPRPGATDEMARGGLQSYDCRNQNNPLILPPFGGAPPCKTQGPWTFNGKSASYPRLTLPEP
jgi:virulence factor Mce-like protein